MSSSLMDVMRKTITGGLQRRSITSCARWAETYREMKAPYPGRWGFKYHPWLRVPHDPGCRRNVFKKCAQIGLTETFLNRTFYNVDVRNMDVLYVLPSERPDASDFSSSRFDAALKLSPHLTNLFGDTKNVGLKRAGAVNVYIRGAKSRSQLKSVPVGCLIFDEVDEMPPKNISLALERTSGQRDPEEWFASTPTVPGEGIDKYYDEGTGEEFFFTCPCCSRRVSLTFPESLIITAKDHRDPEIEKSHLVCSKCKGVLPHESKTEWLEDGVWVPKYLQRAVRSFGINQLYSCTMPPQEIAKMFLKAQINPEDEQEFYNSKMGQAHIVSGARLNNDVIDACRGDFKNKDRPALGGVFTMGVDVGHPWIHYTVVHWKHGRKSNDPHMAHNGRLVAFGKVQSFDELDTMMMEWRPHFTVVDIAPERKAATAFAMRFEGRVRLCVYGNSIAGRSITEKEEERMVTVDRTSWIDLVFSRFRGETIKIPMDVDLEFTDHMKAMVRVYKRDADGNPIGKYVNSKHDHYAHALVYAEIALSLVGKVSSSENIPS